MKLKNTFIILPFTLFFIANSIAQSTCIGQNQKEKEYQKYCGPNTCFKENGIGAVCEPAASNKPIEKPPQDADKIACQGSDANLWSNCVGTVTYRDGNKYVGEWKDGKRNGRGIYFFLADDQWKGDKYDGDFKNDKLYGQGTYSYSNGNKYIGEYKDSQMNGQGTFTTARGEKLIGEFAYGKFNGRGIFYGTDGSIQTSGIYKDNILVTSQYIDPNSFTEIEKYKAKAENENRKIELEREKARQRLAEEKQIREAKAAEEKRLQDAKAAEEKRIQEAKAAEVRRIQEAKEAEEVRIQEAKATEERRVQEAKAAEEKRIQEAKDAKEAEERRIWLTTPAGKKFAAAEAVKAKKEEADRQKAAAIEEARVKKEEAERQKAAAIEQARMEKEELQRQKLALEAQLRENLRVAQENANFEKEFPYYALISCTNSYQFFALANCLDKTEIELRNGSEYGLYKWMDIQMGKLGREKLPPNGEGLKINLRSRFEITAQAGKGNLILGVVIYKTKDNTVIFQKKASEYRVIHVRD